ncbi:MAG: acetate--CoA ligase family protein [Methanomicrobiales archaeon]|nr:acetate--CoA ligase family protein [Methanomicrobiales archaeon]
MKSSQCIGLEVMSVDEKKLLSEAEGYTLLAKYQIPVPPHTVIHGRQKAGLEAEKIGFPVVMKVVSKDISHKSDVGGVITGIQSKEGAEEAFETINQRVNEKAPAAEISGIIIEKELPKGLELFIGGIIDSSFGRVISFGIGGTLVELLEDVSLRVLPISRGEIERQIRDIKGYPLIRGYRGSNPRDENALIDILERVSTLFLTEERIVEFDINPLLLYENGGCAVDARFFVAPTPQPFNLPEVEDVSSQLLRPHSIAVVGASSDPNKLGYVILRNLLPFSGTLYPVNPHHERILGRKTYSSLLDIPGQIDMVLIAVPAPIVPQIMEETGAKGVPLAIIISAGFKETGEEGKKLEEVVLAIARKKNVRILGPNCLGIILPPLGINATFDPLTPHKGHIGFVSQSGAVIATVIDWSIPEGIGFSAVISVGNQADLGFDEFLKYLESDSETNAIILYIEEIVNGKEFMETVKQVSDKKPVVAIKSGSSQLGKEAASSHTGSLAGSYEVYMAAFRQSGVMTTHSLREAFQVAELLSSEGYPHGTRSIVITSAGGFAVLSSDYAESHQVEMVALPDDVIEELNEFLPPVWSHHNPIDLVGDAGADRFARVFDVMIRRQDLWDIAFVVAVPSAIIDPNHLAQEIVRFSTHSHKMIVGCLLGGDSMKSGIRLLREHDIPNFSELEDAFIAVGRSCIFREKCPPQL